MLNHMKWVTKSSSSISQENKIRAADGRPLMNPNLKHKNIKFICEFGGVARKKSKGLRTHLSYSTWKIECPAMLHLVAHTTDSLTVEALHETHAGHGLTEEETDVMPENRKLHPDDQSQLNALLDGKVKPSLIKPLLADMKSGAMNARDIANYRAKRQKENRGGRTEVEMLQDTLVDIQEADPSAYIYLKKDSSDNLQVLFIQTSCMKENVKKYGTVILMDHTYKIDKNGMPVAIVLVVDGEGLGRVVGLAYVANEKSTVASVLDAFRSSIGDEVAEAIKTVVIDKDYSEAGAIAQVFPNVSIQLCNFHVANTLNKASSKGSKEVRRILEDLRICAEEDSFNELCNELKECASPKFWAYYEKNWMTCPLAWSFRSKKVAPNLGNNTTNRLENWNGKAKMVKLLLIRDSACVLARPALIVFSPLKVVDVDSSLYDSLKGLLSLVLSREEDVRRVSTAAQVKRRYISNSSDPVVDEMVNHLTWFASDLIMWEKAEAAKAVVRPSTTVTSCDCSHFINYVGLPCRHTIKMRIDEGNSYTCIAIYA
ncbi:hypothetical protein ONE63_011105 [Megalurothrips usitatus]|uniref:SWIM-type domain-containing protein n=1 Tax=Megalurothrips usitatus TaxID=439358 RepID=A0AAV7XJC9_9NEOP|nr:hypothetical protein ONE63_011105 [Megalurothrips usitatus]